MSIIRKTTTAISFRLVVLVMVSLSACTLPMKPPPGQLPTRQGEGNASLTQVSLAASSTNLPPSPPPTQNQNPTAIFLPGMTITPSATIRPTPIPLPIVTVTAALSKPAAATPTSAPVIQPTSSLLKNIRGSYSVILKSPGTTLAVYKLPYTSSSIVKDLPSNTANLVPTGKTSAGGSIHWVEVTLPSGETGWVDRFYLTEAVTLEEFKVDPAVHQLLLSFSESLTKLDGKQLVSLISPIHGLRVQELRAGTVMVYDADHARWLFETTYQANWGTHPGSGLPVRGSFSTIVLPNLVDVFTDPNTQITYQDISIGGSTYTAAWPKEYSSICFLSEYRPGTPAKELDWRTWLVGIEYVDTKPYLFALHQLFWEP